MDGGALQAPPTDDQSLRWRTTIIDPAYEDPGTCQGIRQRVAGAAQRGWMPGTPVPLDCEWATRQRDLLTDANCGAALTVFGLATHEIELTFSVISTPNRPKKWTNHVLRLLKMCRFVG